MICLCAVCQKPILQYDLDRELVADHFVYKCGELDEIELAHLSCARDWNLKHSSTYWAVQEAA